MTEIAPLETEVYPPRYYDRKWFSRKSPTDGQVPTWDTTNRRWVPATPSGGGAITIREEDGTPIDTAVTILRLPNGTLVVNGAGDVSYVPAGGGALTQHNHDANTDAAGGKLTGSIVDTFQKFETGGIAHVQRPDGAEVVRYNTATPNMQVVDTMRVPHLLLGEFTGGLTAGPDEAFRLTLDANGLPTSGEMGFIRSINNLTLTADGAAAKGLRINPSIAVLAESVSSTVTGIDFSAFLGGNKSYVSSLVDFDGQGATAPSANPRNINEQLGIRLGGVLAGGGRVKSRYGTQFGGWIAKNSYTWAHHVRSASGTPLTIAQRGGLRIEDITQSLRAMDSAYGIQIDTFDNSAVSENWACWYGPINVVAAETVFTFDGTTFTNVTEEADRNTETATTMATGTSSGGNAVNTLNDTTKAWVTNSWINLFVRITGGTGVGQERLIASTTATQVGVSPNWTTTPDATSTYTIKEDFQILADIGDFIYVGLSSQFRAVSFDMKTVRVGGNRTLRAQYSNGAAGWPTMTVASDGTTVFSADGIITLTPPASGWVAETVNGTSRFWVRFSLASGTTDPTTAPTCQMLRLTKTAQALFAIDRFGGVHIGGATTDFGGGQGYIAQARAPINPTSFAPDGSIVFVSAGGAVLGTVTASGDYCEVSQSGNVRVLGPV